MALTNRMRHWPMLLTLAGNGGQCATAVTAFMALPATCFL